MSVNIMIVDDQPLFRDGLKTVLDLEKGIKVIATVSNGKEALLVLNSGTLPDLVLLDIEMLEIDGLGTIKEIKQTYPQIKVLVLTTFNDENCIIQALANGANGYVLKDMETEKLVETIYDAMDGKMVLLSSVAIKLAEGLHKMVPQKPGSTLAELSEREKEIAAMLAQGFSNKQIAMRLFISEGTVRNYISNIYSKIGVEDRTNAVLYFKNQGW